MEQHRKVNTILAALVFIITWVVYFMTKAPTLSFWDCGEFVACSYSLGVPHPPGTPLFVILGKFASMALWFIKEKAVRITLLSVTGGAFSAMFSYIIAVRFLILGYGLPDTFWKKFSLYAGGIISGLSVAFASTLWFNNVESEVYGVNIAVMMFTNWLILKWSEDHNNVSSDRYIILIVFLAFLNIGLHVQSLLVLPSFFLYVILVNKEKLSDWRFWVIGTVLFMQAVEVSTFLWLAPLSFVIILFIMMFSGSLTRRKWQLVFWMSFVALLGYSVHMYIPIRSIQNPIIDENNPETWQSFKYFLERKQYGSESMVSQAFNRHGSLRGQLWDGPNMGYGLYHIKQFFSNMKLEQVKPEDRSWVGFDFENNPREYLRLFLYLMPTFIMLYGMYALYKRTPNASIMFISLYLVGSAGLIFYMNFKDGTVEGFAREVRERDYFFSIGFLYYMFWVGIGSTAIMRFFLDHKSDVLRKIVGPITVLTLLFTPAVPFANNYKDHDRTNNYVPWDYSYNLLMSCKKDGILFTNGDNDTFPVWALQEAYGVRKDVRIVNLSLLNTGWYIEQLKNLEPKVPISFTMDEIKKIGHQRNPFETDVAYQIGKTGLTVTLEGKEKRPILRIQDIMVLNIVASTNWKKPIYFAVTVSDDNKMGLGKYLSMESLVFHLEKQPVNSRMNVEKSIDNLVNVYKYRHIGDGSCHLDNDAKKLLTNYTASFIGIALEERKPLNVLKSTSEKLRTEAELSAKKKSKDSQIKKAKADFVYKQYQERLNRVSSTLKKCISLIPDDWRPRVLLIELMANHGRYEEAIKVAEKAVKIEPTRSEYHVYLAQALEKANRKAEAIKSYEEIIKLNPNYFVAYQKSAQFYKEIGKNEKAIETYNNWLKLHPGDRRAIGAITDIKADTVAKES